MAKTTPTWEQYLIRTRTTATPAKLSRWRGQDRLLFGDRIINGGLTGSALSNLTLPQLQQLLSQATAKADRETLKKHINLITTGPQPGAPADHLLSYEQAGIRATESSVGIVHNATQPISAASATSTKG